MSTIWLVVLEDHHTEVQIEAFLTRESAISRAKEIVAEYDFEPDEPDEPVERWAFNATLSTEGDYVHVEEVEIQP